MGLFVPLDHCAGRLDRNAQHKIVHLSRYARRQAFGNPKARGRGSRALKFFCDGQSFRLGETLYAGDHRQPVEHLAKSQLTKPRHLKDSGQRACPGPNLTSESSPNRTICPAGKDFGARRLTYICFALFGCIPNMHLVCSARINPTAYLPARICLRCDNNRADL